MADQAHDQACSGWVSESCFPHLWDSFQTFVYHSVHNQTLNQEEQLLISACLVFFVGALWENVNEIVVTADAIKLEFWDFFSNSQELNYADLHLSPNKDGKKVQPGLQNNSTEYAQVEIPPAAPPLYEDHMRRMKSAAAHPHSKRAQFSVHRNWHHYIWWLIQSAQTGGRKQLTWG